MGRRDAVQVTLEIVAECRRLLPGLLVTYESGWERRGNGLAANYAGGIVHHTASPSSQSRPFPTQGILRDGRSDLPGPLCNFAGPWCSVEMPRLHVMAAFPANHAGASGGRSMGPLPRTNLFNPVVVGLEIDYAGTSPMTAGQLLVGKVWTRAVANVLGGGNVEIVRAHMETSITGKWDIGYASGRTYDMPGWRRDAAAITAPRPPAPTAPPELTYLEELDMYAQIEPGDTVRIPVPSGRKWRINVVSDSVYGQTVYGKQVSPGRVVGLFYGHPFGTGEKEWELYVAETHNIDYLCSAVSFIEVTNKGQGPDKSRPIAVSLTPA